MSQNDLQSGTGLGPRPMRFVLSPHRSLSRPGFVVLMACIGGVSFVAGIVFAMLGAWPVVGFFGLDVLLIWYAFHRNYRSGRMREIIDIADGRLTLTHVDVAGNRQRMELAAAWVDVRLGRAENGHTRIALASHGREYAFGAFLTEEEKIELAPALRDALLTARGGPRV